jgi:hypothetical protein
MGTIELKFMALRMNNKPSRFLAVLLISLLANFSDIEVSYSQGNNKSSNNLIYLGKNQDNESVFIERSSVKQWANSDEYWFRIAWESQSLYYFFRYMGSCNSVATKALSVTVENSNGEIQYQENYKKGWIYPEKQSILRNALSTGCQIIFQRKR